jgi:hypothetical protein
MKYNITYLVLCAINMAIIFIYVCYYGAIVGLGMAVVSTIGLLAGIISERNEYVRYKR